jgi:hypothetical protein
MKVEIITDAATIQGLTEGFQSLCSVFGVLLSAFIPRLALDRNQSNCVLFGFVHGRHSLMVAPT